MNVVVNSKKNVVTLVITSCGRFDLLQETMSSFFRHNTYPIREVIITDDSDQIVPKFAYAYHKSTTVINPKIRVGQIKSIDRAYERIETDLIFHCEDDWLFLRDGFIEESLLRLNNDSRVVAVWLRNHQELGLLLFINGHFEGHKQGNWIWNYGFTFNPGLRRLKDYKVIGSFNKIIAFDPQNAILSEKAIAQVYKDKGYYGDITDSQGYIRHIGDNRHVFQNLTKLNNITKDNHRVTEDKRAVNCSGVLRARLDKDIERNENFVKMYVGLSRNKK